MQFPQDDPDKSSVRDPYNLLEDAHIILKGSLGVPTLRHCHTVRDPGTSTQDSTSFPLLVSDSDWRLPVCNSARPVWTAQDWTRRQSHKSSLGCCSGI